MAAAVVAAVVIVGCTVPGASQTLPPTPAETTMVVGAHYAGTTPRDGCTYCAFTLGQAMGLRVELTATDDDADLFLAEHPPTAACTIQFVAFSARGRRRGHDGDHGAVLQRRGAGVPRHGEGVSGSREV